MNTVNLNILAADFKKYTLDDSAILYLSFDQPTLTNEIDDQVINYIGNLDIIYVPSPHGSGLKMQPNQKFNTSLGGDISQQFTVGFWLRPTNIRPNINTATGLPIYFRTSLFDKSNFSYSSISQYVSASDASFVFYEENREDNHNVLKILLISNNFDEIYLETEKYETGKFHHFWISYYGPTRTLDVYIDGKIVSLYSEDGSQIPTSINNNVSTKFNINNSAVGYSSTLRNNSGVLDEFAFFTKYISDSRLLSKIINYGTQTIIETVQLYEEQTHECFMFDDPTFLGVTSLAMNGKSIYVGRNDGALYKGDRLMWQSRREFGNPKEIEGLQKYIKDVEKSSIQLNKGNLEIKAASVRM